MSIKSDNWIKHMCQQHGLIEPYVESQIRYVEGSKILSYGLSSFGYDVRCKPEFKIFTNINSTVIDPKQFDERSFVDVKGDVCIIPPNSFALGVTLETFDIPRDVLCICLGKSSYARCFSGDTEVLLTTGEHITFKDMVIRSIEGEVFWGYSLNHRGETIIVRLDAPRLIGIDRLLKITHDNGKVDYSTPDHEFMTQEGKWLAASDLFVGKRLMKLTQKMVDGHRFIRTPSTGNYVPEVSLAYAWSRRHWMLSPRGDYELRYINGDTLDNSPPNIGRFVSDKLDHPNEVEGIATLPVANHRHSPPNLITTAILTNSAKYDKGINNVASIEEVEGEHDVYCLTVGETGNFMLASGMIVKNCGIIVNVTPIEPEFRGQVVLEFSNTTPLPAKIYANEGVAQFLFFQSNEPCDVSYADRGGKYQGQTGITLPKT